MAWSSEQHTSCIGRSLFREGIRGTIDLSSNITRGTICTTKISCCERLHESAGRTRYLFASIIRCIIHSIRTWTYILEAGEIWRYELEAIALQRIGSKKATAKFNAGCKERLRYIHGDYSSPVYENNRSQTHDCYPNRLASYGSVPLSMAIRWSTKCDEPHDKGSQISAHKRRLDWRSHQSSDG